MTEQSTYRQGRLSRRRIVRGTALGSASLVAALAIGCVGQEKPTLPDTASGATQPRRGGIITRHGGPNNTQDSDGRRLDPHTESNVGITLRLVYQGLLGYNLRTYEVEPDLAQSWEQPSATEYIFKLRSGVRWQNKPPVNGREVIAHDVVFSLNRARTNEPRFIHRSVLGIVDKIEAVDAVTVRVTTKRPDAATLNALAADPMLVLNPEVVEKAERVATADEVVGTGPFIMTSTREKIGAEYVRNPNYFKPDRPYLDGVRTHYFEDLQTAYAAFLAGRLDISQVPGTQVKEYLAAQGPDFTPEWHESNAIFALVPHTQKKPFDDRRVTRALRLLVDHQEFVTAWSEVVFGKGRLGSIFGSALKAWDVPEEEYRRHIFWQQPKDPAIREAMALLSAAGFDRANPLRFELSCFAGATIEPGGQLLHAQFRRNGQGIVQTSDLKIWDKATGPQVLARGQFEYTYWPIGPSIPEPGFALNEMWRTGGSRNHWHFSDPRLDELIDKQNVTLEPRERKALVLEIVRYMMDNAPGVAGSLSSTLNAVNRKVRDYAPENFLNGRQYEWIWLAA